MQNPAFLAIELFNIVPFYSIIIKSLLVATTFSRFANSRVQIRSGANEPPAVVNEQNKVWAPRIQMLTPNKRAAALSEYPYPASFLKYSCS